MTSRACLVVVVVVVVVVVAAAVVVAGGGDCDGRKRDFAGRVEGGVSFGETRLSTRQYWSAVVAVHCVLYIKNGVEQR